MTDYNTCLEFRLNLKGLLGLTINCYMAFYGLTYSPLLNNACANRLIHYNKILSFKNIVEDKKSILRTIKKCSAVNKKYPVQKFQLKMFWFYFKSPFIYFYVHSANIHNIASAILQCVQSNYEPVPQGM